MFQNITAASIALTYICTECDSFSIYRIAGKFRRRIFCDLRVDSSRLCIDINDFANKLSRTGSSHEKREILTSRKFPTIRYTLSIYVCSCKLSCMVFVCTVW